MTKIHWHHRPHLLISIAKMNLNRVLLLLFQHNSIDREKKRDQRGAYSLVLFRLQSWNMDCPSSLMHCYPIVFHIIELKFICPYLFASHVIRSEVYGTLVYARSPRCIVLVFGHGQIHSIFRFGFFSCCTQQIYCEMRSNVYELGMSYPLDFDQELTKSSSNIYSVLCDEHKGKRWKFLNHSQNLMCAPRFV